MLDTRKKYNSKGSRIAYHWKISFPPGEGTPEELLRVGRQWFESTLGAEYEAVLSVHVDKEHLHLHILFNATKTTGRKYRYARGDLEKKLYGELNRLCRQKGLSEWKPTKNPDNLSYKEWMLRQQGCRSIKEMIRADMDRAIEKARTFGGFLRELEDMGYEVDTRGKYLKIRAPGGKDNRRMYKLGAGYTEEDVHARLEGRMPAGTVLRPKKRRYVVAKTDEAWERAKNGGKKYSYFRWNYMRYMYELGYWGQPAQKLSFPERKKAGEFAKRVSFLFFKDITSEEDLTAKKTEAEKRLVRIEGKRKELSAWRSRRKNLWTAARKADSADGEAREKAEEYLKKRGCTKEQLRTEREQYYEKAEELRQTERQLTDEIQMYRRILEDNSVKAFLNNDRKREQNGKKQEQNTVDDRQAQKDESYDLGRKQ